MSGSIALDRFISAGSTRTNLPRGDIKTLLSQTAFAAKIIAREVRRAALVGRIGLVGEVNPTGDAQKELDVFANQVFLYPADCAHPKGKLRLLYECAPAAFLAEQAEGRATTGRERILDLRPASLHDTSPLAIGSSDNVANLERVLAEAGTDAGGRDGA